MNIKSQLTKFSQHPFWADPLVLVCIFIHLAFNLAQWLILIFGLREFRGYPIPLHYTILGGVDEVGNWINLLTLPLAALAIGLTNAVIGFFAYRREKLLSYFLAVVGLFLQALLLIITLAFLKLVRG